jgi:hypothetical protein
MYGNKQAKEDYKRIFKESYQDPNISGASK